MAGEERAVKVQLQHLKMAFNGRKGEMVALNGVDLDIHENEFVTVVGPSGCGKSTLLNIIAGLLKPTSGGRGARAGRGVPAVRAVSLADRGEKRLLCFGDAWHQGG